MPTIDEIVAAIDGRLLILQSEIEQLATARRALTDGRSTAPSRPRRARRARATTSRPTVTRPARERRPRAKQRKAPSLSAAQVESILGAGDGQAMTTSGVAERAGGSRERVLALLRELESAGRVRRSGQRRATRWHAVTDEDRIAQRAAEIAASSRSA